MSWSGYQTILLEDGTVIPGLFPTIEWYNRMGSMMNFSNKTVLDIGCNDGMMGLLAKRAKAKYVLSVDNNARCIMNTQDLFKRHNLECNVHHGDIDTVKLKPDILIASMIIHWIGQEQLQRLLTSTKQTAVIIFRADNPHYEISAHGKWFPTRSELTTVMRNSGFNLVYEHELMTQDNGKEIVMAIYDRCKQVIWSGDQVTKYNINLDEEWVNQINQLKEYVELPHLLSHKIGSYTTEYIDGEDLWGDLPFSETHTQRIMVYSDRIRTNITRLYLNNLHAGMELGYMFSDISRRNIILKKGTPYLIDLDDICTIENKFKWAHTVKQIRDVI